MSAEPTFCQCDFLHLISEIITESNLEIYSRVETRLRLFLPIFKQNLPATLLMTASSMQWRQRAFVPGTRKRRSVGHWVHEHDVD